MARTPRTVQPVRRQSPDRPPLFSSTRTSVIAAAAVDRLDHVDQREPGDARRRSAPPSRRRCGRRCAPWRVMSTASSATCEVDLHAVDGDRVAQRDQVGGALGGLDAGDPRHRERVALGHAAAAQQARPPRPRPGPGRSPSPSRTVTSLPETSTIRAAPLSSTWVSRARSLMTGRRSSTITSTAPPSATSVTSSGTTISALACARPPTRCEPAPPTGRHDVPPVGRRRASRARTAACPAGEGSACWQTAPHGRAGAAARRRASAGSPGGRTPRTRRTRHRVARQREDRRAVRADGAEALRLAGLHRDLLEARPCPAGTAPP